MTDTFRRQYANSVRSEIQILEKAQLRDQENLDGLRNLRMDQATRDRKKAEIEDTIQTRTEKLEELEDKVKDILLGLYDEDQRKNIDQSKKPVPKPEVKFVNLKVEDEERTRRKDFRYYQGVLYKIDATLPEKFKLNLESMPANKGYIWKGVWYFGNLPEERGQPMIMFERLYGGVMRIHEINSYEHIIYEKKNKDPKKLISRKRRLVKKFRQL